MTVGQFFRIMDKRNTDLDRILVHDKDTGIYSELSMWNVIHKEFYDLGKKYVLYFSIKGKTLQLEVCLYHLQRIDDYKRQIVTNRLRENGFRDPEKNKTW